jgi:hypothetical protein
VLLACGASDPAPADPSDAGPSETPADGGDAPTTSFGDSACGTCVAQQCAQEYGWCEAEPQCQAYLACLGDCPVGAGGNVDAACEAACPATPDTLALRTHAFVATCRAYGPGATACPACGVDPAAEPLCALLDQKCAPPTSAAPCAACREAHCCDSQAAFDADAEARALGACLASCSGYACAKGCADEHPGGVAEAAALTECVAHWCPTDCYQPPLTSCQQCAQTKCANPTCGYFGDEQGWLLDTCRQACAGDKACQLACRDQHPSAVFALETSFACVQVACASECE